MGSTIESLKNDNPDTQDILQKYFMPCNNLNKFLTQLRAIVKQNNINLLNVTIRYVKADTESLLAYAPPEDRFALVLYLNLKN